MPELPEVETVRRGLQPVMEGFQIAKAEARRKDLRFPFQKDFIARLDGQTVTGLGRRAKYLMADLGSGDVLLMHLGMSGSFRVVANEKTKTPGEFHHPRSEDRAHDHVVFHMSSGASVVFNDPRRFGYMKIIARHALEAEPLLKGLGPEPLGNEFDAQMLARACADKKTSLKAALLDQRVVAGLGNIYVCEALYRSQLSPRRSAATLATRKSEPTDHAKRLVDRHSRRAQPGHRGRRLVAARSSPDLGRTRLFPAFISGLRPRRRDMPDRQMRRHRQAVHPERAFDLLVPEVPEVIRVTPTIPTRRLVLRPLALSDAPAIQRHFNNWNIIRRLASVVPWPYPDDGAESFIRQQLEKIAAGEEIYQWVLVLRDGDGEAIGNISFRPRSGDPKGNRGFWLAEPYWSRGLMTEAISSVNDFAFGTLGIESFHVCNAVSNTASRRVKQKTGAEFVGIIELPHHDGQTKAERWKVSRESWLARGPTKSA